MAKSMTSAIAIPAYAVVSVLAVMLLLLIALLLLRRRNKHSAAAFETLFAASSDGLLLLERTGRIVRANAAALGLFHAAADGLAGRLFQELLQDPEFAADDPWDLAKGPDQPLPCMFRRTECGCGFHAQVRFQPLREAARELLLVTIRDQSGILQLQSCQARLFALHENGFQGIAVLQEGIFVYANLLFERLSGRSVTQLAEQDAREIFYPQDQEFAWHELTQGARCEEANRCFPCRLQNPDGTAVWVRVATICMQWEERPALFCFFTDISAMKALEALRSELHYLDAADTRALLESVIELPRRILRRGVFSSAQELELRLVEQAGYGLLRTLHHSLDFYRMESGAYAVSPVAVDLLALLDRVREDLAAAGEAGKERILLDCEGPQPDARVFVTGDPLLLYTLFYDSASALCSLAVPDSRVTCRLAYDADTVEVVFTGWTGKDSDFQTPVAARIAALHQGRVLVRAATPELWELSVTLPGFPTEGAGTPEDSDPVVAPWPLGRMLVAAAAPAEFAAGKTYFERLPCVVDRVSSGRQAVEQYQTRAYDLVCVDMRMTDGLEAVQQIRAFEQQSGRERAPIVALLSPNGDPGDRSYFEVGCQAVLQQPFDSVQLLRLVRRFTRLSKEISVSD